MERRARQGTEPPEWALQDFSADVGWDPAAVYAYEPQRSAEDVRRTVLREAGAGRLRIVPPEPEGSRAAP